MITPSRTLSELARHVSDSYSSSIMSHGHTHAPGESHDHSHGPSAPAPQQAIAAPPDPAGQALIDQDFKPIELSLAADGHTATCAHHSLEKCTDCDVDYVALNRMSRILAQNPNLRCFPPPNAVTNNLSQAITGKKEEGNVCPSYMYLNAS